MTPAEYAARAIPSSPAMMTVTAACGHAWAAGLVAWEAPGEYLALRDAGGREFGRFTINFDRIERAAFVAAIAPQQ